MICTQALLCQTRRQVCIAFNWHTLRRSTFRSKNSCAQVSGIQIHGNNQHRLMPITRAPRAELEVRVLISQVLNLFGLRARSGGSAAGQDRATRSPPASGQARVWCQGKKAASRVLPTSLDSVLPTEIRAAFLKGTFGPCALREWPWFSRQK